MLQRKTSSAGSSRLGAVSDGRRSLGARSAGTGSSDSGAGSDKGSQLNPSGGDGKQPPPLLAAVNMASMYDSLAAELREKLGGGNKQQPLLLPPRDYDTVHRSRGNIVGIEARRSLNPRIVGGVAATAKNTVGGEETTAWNGGRIDHNSSGHSSGIGSDTAPSPLLQEFPPDPDDGRSSSGIIFLKQNGSLWFLRELIRIMAHVAAPCLRKN